MKSLFHLPAGGFLSLLLFAGPLAAQGGLLDARMQVTLPPLGEAIHVQLTYRILPAPGAKEVPLSLLTPEPARVASLRAWLDGQELAFSGQGALGIHLERTRDHFSEGSVRLPEDVREGRDALSLQLTYTVESPWTKEGRATLPLVVPRWIPDEPTPLTFLANVDVPEGLTIMGSFPTSVLSRPPPGEGGTYEIGLQGVPAMLVLRVVRGEGSLITLERGLDLFVVLILLVMGALGVRYLKGRER
jgi:hypothetical protein